MLQFSSRSVLQKCDKNERDGYYRGEDRISGLPDEILVVILSLLTFKEAVTSSILSRRWRYLWTFITSDLNFDTGKPYGDEAFDEEAFIRDRDIYKSKFVAWVNNVLKVHQGTTEVDQFRVRFNLDASYCNELDSWVKFAAEKRVRRLELNLSNFVGFGQSHPYSLKHPPSFNALAALRLINVDVTEEVLNYVLANCPSLEQLCVEGSETLTNLKIYGGASLKLRHLVLYRCRSLENLEISAPNLVSFTYTGPKKVVPFENVPLLSELCLGDQYCKFFIFKASQHLGYFSQLQKLTLILPKNVVLKGGLIPSNLPKLFNLKQLELRIALQRGFPLICFTSLLKAAPSLSKFVLKLLFCETLSPELTLLMAKGVKRHRRKTKHSHQCLKLIEVVGFIGDKTDFELAVHLLEIVEVSLEKITIDTHRPCSFWGPDVAVVAINPTDTQDSEAARERARQLQPRLPPGAELVIL